MADEFDVPSAIDSALADDPTPVGDRVRRDRWGRYLLPQPPEWGLSEHWDSGHIRAMPTRVSGGKDVPAGEKAWTRASTFAKSISDTYTLSQWAQRMAIKGITLREDLYALAAATPLEDKDTLNDIAERAKDAAGAKAAAALGTAVHAFTEQYDRGQEPTVPAAWRPDVDAYAALTRALGLRFDASLIERTVAVSSIGKLNSAAGVAGTFDRIATVTQNVELADGLTLGDYRVDVGDRLIVDLKTGRDLSYGWYEIAIQLALYANADAIWDRHSNTYYPMPEVNKKLGLVIHLPVGKGEATAYWVDIERGWRGAQLAEMVREWRNIRNLASIVEVAESQEKPDYDTAITAEDVRDSRYEGPVPNNVVELRPATLKEKIMACRTKADLSQLWKENIDVWTDEYTALGKEQLSKLHTP